MAEQRYRFGGPIPESVLALRARRKRAKDECAVSEALRRWDAEGAPARRASTAGAERAGSAIEREQARAVLAPFERHDAPATPDLLPLCAWRIEGQDFSRPGFTTDIEQAKFWIGRNATVTPLHLPSEDGKFRTVSGAVLEKLTPPASVDSWGCPLRESASTAGAESQAPATRCGSHSPSACPSGCGARNPNPALSAPDRFEEIAARARDFRRG